MRRYVDYALVLWIAVLLARREQAGLTRRFTELEHRLAIQGHTQQVKVQRALDIYLETMQRDRAARAPALSAPAAATSGASAPESAAPPAP